MEACRIAYESLKLINGFDGDRRLKGKVENSLISWKKSTFGTPQGSVLGLILFNLLINDFFYNIQHCRVCNFADDSTIFSCDKILEPVVAALEMDMKSSVQCFNDNGMVANPEKFLLTFFGLNSNHKLCIDMNGKVVPMTYSVNLLGITIDSRLTFNEYINHLCNKV